MIMPDRGARVLDWLAGGLAGLGDAANELGREVVRWSDSLGQPGLALGAGAIALGVLVLLWYASRR